MNLENYSEYAGLGEKTEIEKSLYLVYFLLVVEKQPEVTVQQLSDLLEKLHFSRPNPSRLKLRLKQSRSFIYGSAPNSFKIHASKIQNLRAELPQVSTKSEQVVHDEAILPETLYKPSRGYIEKLADQINACYEANIFDGCAVLMRRLLEICLILAYEKIGIASAIKDSGGNYKMLQLVIADAKCNSKLDLSRNTKSCLNTFRTLGNFSAHKIYYNAKRSDVRKMIQDYRACVEELLYKAEILK